MFSFTAFTAWGQLYQCAGTAPDPGAVVQLRDLQSWVLLRGAKSWRRIQSSSDLQGAAFAEDFVGPAVAARFVTRGPGGTSVTPVPRHNFHFWPGSGRVGLQPRDVAAVVVMLRARVQPRRSDNARRPCLVLSVGGDLWKSINANTGSANGDVGIGRFKRVGRRWRLYTMSTASPTLLHAHPLFAAT